MKAQAEFVTHQFEGVPRHAVVTPGSSVGTRHVRGPALSCCQGQQVGLSGHRVCPWLYWGRRPQTDRSEAVIYPRLVCLRFESPVTCILFSAMFIFQSGEADLK